MQNFLANFIEDCQQSTFWIGHTGEEAISALAIRETANEVFIEVRIPDIDRQTLEIEFTQETVLFRGKWAEKNGVEGYFHPGRFQSIVPLPHPVFPETVVAEFKDDILKVRFRKQGLIAQSRIRLDLGRSSAMISPPDRELIPAKNLIFEKQSNEDFTAG